MNELSIQPGKCIRCGSCVVFAPGIFAIGTKGPSQVVRQPATPEEERLARAALLNCPTSAVKLGVEPSVSQSVARDPQWPA